MSTSKACISIGRDGFQKPLRRKLSFVANMTSEIAAERAVPNATPRKRSQGIACESEKVHS